MSARCMQKQMLLSQMKDANVSMYTYNEMPSTNQGEMKKSKKGNEVDKHEGM